ncbi:MAG: hypothetical protein ACPGO5_00070 [Patescibacteria group bacterium]
MGDFLIGVIMVGIGFTMLKFTLFYLKNFGRIPFFEKHLHHWGGSFLFYKLLGLLLSFFGILQMVGLLEPFTVWIVGSLFGPAFFTEAPPQ